MTSASGEAPVSGQAESPNPLYVVTIGGGSAIQSLSAALLTGGATPIDSSDAGLNALKRDAHAHMLLMYPNPASDLASRLQGNAQETSIHDWFRTYENVLDTYRHYRSRVTLVDADAAMNASPQLQSELRMRFGVLLELPVASAPKIESAPGPVPLAIAGALLREDSHFAAVLEELEASSLPLPSPELLNAEDLVNAWGDLTGSPRSAVEAAEEEAESLLQQLHQVQEELETYYFANRDLEQKHQDTVAEASKLGQRVDTLEQENALLQAALSAMRSSKSWALTAPLRKGLDLMGGGS